VIKPGTGTQKPGATDLVTVHYTGWTTDGKMFDSSHVREAPSSFPLDRVIAGWRECVGLMVVGETRRCWIPQELAYKGQPGRPAGMLVFDVELLDAKTSPATPPPDVAAPPSDAKRTASGLAFKVLKPGTGTEKPSSRSRVTVHYTGWTTDGKMFDSSVLSGKPATFPLNRLIRGWGEGVPLMVVGEKRRFWIPQTLAYNGQPGRPAGMLVFDIELIDTSPSPTVPPADVTAPPKDAKRTASGLAYKSLRPGKGGDRPTAASTVTVHYTGWTTDGKMFDSSVTKGRPGDYSLEGMMPGWSEGIQTMVVGQKNRFWIPEELAYKGRPGRPAGMLVYETELVEVKEMPEPPPTPKDVKAPPKDAKKTEKGVFYKVLVKGTGSAKPTEQSKVKVHYTGWTTDGKMFDSSVTRGKPITFGLDNVIPGWTDGLQQMTVGEKARLWIPEELAYKGKPGRPQGMLVFEVELLEIDPQPGSSAPMQTK
jgi:FKBP-type peptidyl-prolyl cis-trans isomerase